MNSRQEAAARAERAAFARREASGEVFYPPGEEPEVRDVPDYDTRADEARAARLDDLESAAEDLAHSGVVSTPGFTRDEYDWINERADEIKADALARLDPFGQWMVTRNIECAPIEGTAVVLTRLRSQGYWVAAAGVEIGMDS